MTRKAKSPALKAMYSVNDLARLMGCTRWQVIHFIETNGIPTMRYGKRGKLWVMLSHIAMTFPDLFNSIELIHMLGRQRKREETENAIYEGKGPMLPPSNGSVGKLPNGLYRARVQDGPLGGRQEVNLGNYPSELEAWEAIQRYRAKRETE